ncbi:hypothetical protein DM860_003647 [Cuscuta australis]|uniref:Uncharacterized protein n=2 Tax=cellular organisms TaxID=131567 RepID=A0A328DJV0_9ASTE|nr:hypothetical protein DM860_003647 [Cuscuta australis]
MATGAPSWADQWGEEDNPEKKMKEQKKKKKEEEAPFSAKFKDLMADTTQKSKDAASKAVRFVKSKLPSPNKKKNST